MRDFWRKLGELGLLGKPFHQGKLTILESLHKFTPKYVKQNMMAKLEMFYLNTIEQLFLFVEQLDQLEVCLPYSRLLTGIQILLVFQNLRWNSNKTTLVLINIYILSS